MVVKIRLARAGCRHQPIYRITVANAWAKRDGKYIERVGSYTPVPEEGAKTKLIQLNFDRIKYWLSVGAQPTDTVARLLGKATMFLFITKLKHCRPGFFRQYPEALLENNKLQYNFISRYRLPLLQKRFLI